MVRHYAEPVFEVVLLFNGYRYLKLFANYFSCYIYCKDSKKGFYDILFFMVSDRN